MQNGSMPNLKASDLHGSWELVEWRIEYSEGRAPSWPFGKDAVGVLMYAPDGWMSATMSKRERAALTDGTAMKPDEASRARSFGEYLAYCGTWTLSGSTVSHDVRMSMNPVLIGLPHAREAALDGNALTLIANEPGPAGATRVHHILWRSVPALSAATTSPLATT